MFYLFGGKPHSLPAKGSCHVCLNAGATGEDFIFMVNTLAQKTHVISIRKFS